MAEQVDKRLLNAASALHVSSDLDEVARAFHGEICGLISADVVAICLSRPEGAFYDWYTTDCPASFFDEYPSLAAKDFIATAVKQRPNRVLVDHEMAPRPLIESNGLYVRAHELGLPFEQAMSVLVDGELGHGGVTFYRTRRKPFTERERRALQLLVKPLGQAISRCRGYARDVDLRELIEVCLSAQGLQLLVVDERGREQFRSEGLTDLVGSWFAAKERVPNGLPKLLPCWRNEVLQWPRDQTVGRLHVREHEVERLEVRGQDVRTASGRRYVAFVFTEHALPGRLPDELGRKLTQRQREVAQAVLRGWDNQLIAQQLGCTLGTVKKHVYMIFETLGVDSRIRLQVLAQRLRNER